MNCVCTFLHFRNFYKGLKRKTVRTHKTKCHFFCQKKCILNNKNTFKYIKKAQNIPQNINSDYHLTMLLSSKFNYVSSFSDYILQLHTPQLCILYNYVCFVSQRKNFRIWRGYSKSFYVKLTSLILPSSLILTFKEIITNKAKFQVLAKMRCLCFAGRRKKENYFWINAIN